MSRQHLSWQHLSISGISQLLLTRLWPNFKGRFLGLSWTNFNYCSNICPGNFCSGDICPYQEYLSCYWPIFDQTFWTGFLAGLGSKFCLDQNLVWPKLFEPKLYGHIFFGPRFFRPKFFGPKIFWTFYFFRSKLFWT